MGAPMLGAEWGGGPAVGMAEGMAAAAGAAAANVTVRPAARTVSPRRARDATDKAGAPFGFRLAGGWGSAWRCGACCGWAPGGAAPVGCARAVVLTAVYGPYCPV